MFEMQVLDLIMANVDRNRGNFTVTVSGMDDPKATEWNIDELQAIDNDLSFGKSSLRQLFNKKRGGKLENISNTAKYMKEMPISENMYNLFFGDESGVLKENIINSQRDLRTDEELASLDERFEEVKSQFQKLRESGRLKVVTNAEEWRAYFRKRYSDSQFKSSYNLRMYSRIVAHA